MKANELRIGDYVKFMLNDEDYEIISIDVKDLELIEKKQGVYEPIELTEEWLLKFGFVFGIELQDFVKGKHQFIELNCLCGYFSENDIFYYAEKTKLKYVHQLQNLYFALTGEELTFKSE